jgi:hypothetical protein
MEIIYCHILITQMLRTEESFLVVFSMPVSGPNSLYNLSHRFKFVSKFWLSGIFEGLFLFFQILDLPVKYLSFFLSTFIKSIH